MADAPAQPEAVEPDGASEVPAPGGGEAEVEVEGEVEVEVEVEGFMVIGKPGDIGGIFKPIVKSPGTPPVVSDPGTPGTDTIGTGKPPKPWNPFPGPA